MSTLSSNRRALVASVSFVLALGAVTVCPTERMAFAQPRTTKKERERKEKERKEAEAAAAANATDEDKKKEDEDRKKAEEAKKAPPPPPPEEKEEKKELDDSVEASKAIYVSGDIGITRSDLGAIKDNLGFDRTVANGLLYGLATGLRLKDLRLGVRWRVYDTTEFSLWTFCLSAGYGLKFRPVSPIFSAHVGYVFDQRLQGGLFKSSLPEGTVLPPDVDVRGLLAGVDVNASYWITRYLRLGAFIGADAMFLQRQQAQFPKSLFGATPSAVELSGRPLYADSGSGIGLNVNVGLRGAFDIGMQ